MQFVGLPGPRQAPVSLSRVRFRNTACSIAQRSGYRIIQGRKFRTRQEAGYCNIIIRKLMIHPNLSLTPTAKYALSVVIAWYLMACAPHKTGHYAMAALVNDSTINAVIEIPAGTNKKTELNTATHTFETDKRDGQDRIIRFLPYPANYGFIPGTLSDKTKGGDGDAIDILVIGEAMQTGTVIQVIPIAMLQLTDDGEEDFKVLAVPADAQLNVLRSSRAGTIRNMEAIKQIIAAWFLNYDTDAAQVTGWSGQEETMRYIRDNLAHSN